jgi:hypothetical protein
MLVSSIMSHRHGWVSDASFMITSCLTWRLGCYKFTHDIAIHTTFTPQCFYWSNVRLYWLNRLLAGNWSPVLYQFQVSPCWFLPVKSNMSFLFIFVRYSLPAVWLRAVHDDSCSRLHTITRKRTYREQLTREVHTSPTKLVEVDEHQIYTL